MDKVDLTEQQIVKDIFHARGVPSLWERCTFLPDSVRVSMQGDYTEQEIEAISIVLSLLRGYRKRGQ